MYGMRIIAAIPALLLGSVESEVEGDWKNSQKTHRENGGQGHLRALIHLKIPDESDGQQCQDPICRKGNSRMGDAGIRDCRWVYTTPVIALVFWMTDISHCITYVRDRDA